ncbi:MAG TPA: hypothetical protein DCZ95_10930 [Verrucomicrobia bacterium]|nr:MAG: hypothetical protein A2X46_08060 [Lentisphaerae bacterium GWF2_57_35]HBA84598.1 hypothetical protein [Verrucomicrobiota bacterium]
MEKEKSARKRGKGFRRTAAEQRAYEAGRQRIDQLGSPNETRLYAGLAIDHTGCIRTLPQISVSNPKELLLTDG